MKVQRVRLKWCNQASWIVLDDGYRPIQPLKEFLAYLGNIERSPNTIRAYAYHLKLYWEYLRAVELDWKQVGLTELANFVAWLRNPQPSVILMHEQAAKRTEATVNAVLSSVAMFYNYQEHSGNVEGSPLYHFKVQPHRRYKSFLHHINKAKPSRVCLIKLKEPKRTPKILTQEQVKQLIAACNRTRDKFLICLLYETGMRIGQALGLRHEDIQSWDNIIRIVPREGNINGARTKTKEAYIIHVSMELMELYTDYLLNEFEETVSDYVFVNLWDGQRGTPMQYGAIADLFRRLSKKTEINAHPHLLRHTHATELIRDGKWDMAYVQKRLGHAQVQTTINTYTHLSEADLKQAYQEYIEKRQG